MFGNLIQAIGGAVFTLGIYWLEGRGASALCGGVMLVIAGELAGSTQLGIRDRTSNAFHSLGEATAWMGDRLRRDELELEEEPG